MSSHCHCGDLRECVYAHEHTNTRSLSLSLSHTHTHTHTHHTSRRRALGSQDSKSSGKLSASSRFSFSGLAVFHEATSVCLWGVEGPSVHSIDHNGSSICKFQICACVEPRSLYLCVVGFVCFPASLCALCVTVSLFRVFVCTLYRLCVVVGCAHLCAQYTQSTHTQLKDTRDRRSSQTPSHTWNAHDFSVIRVLAHELGGAWALTHTR